jgi:uncharacterized protein YacL
VSEPQPPTKPATQGIFVELVRLALVALFTAGGWQIAEALSVQETGRLLIVVLGSLIGYVAGGIIGRRAVVAVSAVEREFQRMPASELLAAVLGLILGLVIAALASIMLFQLPPAAAYPTVALVGLILGYVGYRLGRAKRDELFGVFGLKTQAFTVSADEVNVIDTSAFIDGRVLDVVRAGFMGGVMLVPRGVLDELQRIADASDPTRRARGQRGLEVLGSLQREPSVEVQLDESEPAGGDVDAVLIRLARERSGSLVTGDANLAKVAGALDVPVRSVNALAEALRPSLLPGEEVTVRLAKEGREHGQGVGYLDDGTMVVVEGGRERLGSDVRVTVTNVLQTTSGRMLFARLGEE